MQISGEKIVKISSASGAFFIGDGPGLLVAWLSTTPPYFATRLLLFFIANKTKQKHNKNYKHADQFIRFICTDS